MIFNTFLSTIRAVAFTLITANVGDVMRPARHGLHYLGLVTAGKQFMCLAGLHVRLGAVLSNRQRSQLRISAIVDAYVIDRLQRLRLKRAGRNLRAGQATRWDREYFERLERGRWL